MIARATLPEVYAAAAARVSPRWRAFLSPEAFDAAALRASGARCYLSACGRAGFHIVGGDFRGLFAAPDAPRGLGRALAAEAPRLGARTLDCFDGFLPALYAGLGWVEAWRAPFDPALAPAGFGPERPDVIGMRRPPESPEAIARRRAFIHAAEALESAAASLDAAASLLVDACEDRAPRAFYVARAFDASADGSSARLAARRAREAAERA